MSSSFVKLSWYEPNENIVRFMQNKSAQKSSEQFSLSAIGLNQPYVSYESATSQDNPQKGIKFSIRVPIVEDIPLDFRTNFQEIGDKFDPGGLVSTFSTFQSATGVTSSFAQIFQYPIWQKTENVKLNLELVLAVQTDALLDVIIPALSLSNLCAISQIGGGDSTSYRVPGININNFSSVNQTASGVGGTSQPNGVVKSTNTSKEQAEDKFKADSYSKFIELNLPFYENSLMLVMEAKPSFSSLQTESHLSAYAKVSLQLQSLFPANDVDIYSKIKSRLI